MAKSYKHFNFKIILTKEKKKATNPVWNGIFRVFQWFHTVSRNICQDAFNHQASETGLGRIDWLEEEIQETAQ